MTTLAEDLLKSRGIHELKLLVNDLSNEAEGKKIELQRTVGSQYQDFIQSADKIIDMKLQTQSILEDLGKFWASNNAMVVSINNIFESGSGKKAKSTPSSSFILSG